MDRNKNNILGSANIFFKVALRKESVDRNGIIDILRILSLSRSPQGERG